MFGLSSIKSKSKLKALLLLTALIASIVIVFGGVYWILGVIILVLSLCFRLIIAISPDREIHKSQQIEREHVVTSVLDQAERVYADYVTAQRNIAEAYRESVEEVELTRPADEVTSRRTGVRTLISHLPGETMTSYLARPVNITVIGIGGSGCNLITNMTEKEITDIKLVAMNTDAEALKRTKADVHIKLGSEASPGINANGGHYIERRFTEESRNEVINTIRGADLVIIVCGMGGGTGTGAAPIVAQISKQIGSLTIAVVTKPFTFEGEERLKSADEGIMRLLGTVDTLVIIPNDKILQIVDGSAKVNDAFKMADEAVFACVQAISEVITVPGLINLDFLDLKAILKDAGPAWMSIGQGSGKNRATVAAHKALSNPLMDVSLENSKNVLFNVKGGSNLTLFEVNEAAEIIKEAVDPEANIIFGVTHDPAIGNKIKIVLIATGFALKSTASEQKSIGKISLTPEGLKSTETVDIPSFLRRPLFSHRGRRIDKGEAIEKGKETDNK